MTATFMTSRIVPLILAGLVALPLESAGDEVVNLCGAQAPGVRTGAWVLDVSYERGQTAAPANNLKQMSLACHTAGDGAPIRPRRVFAAGSAEIHDGTSNTVLVGERPPRPSCADVDGNGVAGVTRLRVVMRDARSGALVPVMIVPNDGEIDGGGKERVTIIIGEVRAVGTARTHVWVSGTELSL